MYWLTSNVESRKIFASSKYMSLKLKLQHHSPCIETWHLTENLSFQPSSSSLQSSFENSHLNLEDLFLKAPAKSLLLLPPHPQTERSWNREATLLCPLHRRESGTISSYVETKLWVPPFLFSEALLSHRCPQILVWGTWGALTCPPFKSVYSRLDPPLEP